MNDFVTRTLVTFAEDNDSLWWRYEHQSSPNPGTLQLFANCSDTFFWGSSDLEDITADTIEILERSAAQLIAAQGSIQGLGDYYSARVRGMRPQGAAYPVRYDQRIWGLLNDCGPMREAGSGNPRAVPEFTLDAAALQAALATEATPSEVEVDIQLRDALLEIFSFDYTDDLKWKVEEGRLIFFIEGVHNETTLHQLSMGDVDSLRQAKTDMKETGQDYLFADLFLARAGYEINLSNHSFDEDSLALIKAAGNAA